MWHLRKHAVNLIGTSEHLDYREGMERKGGQTRNGLLAMDAFQFPVRRTRSESAESS